MKRAGLGAVVYLKRDVAYLVNRTTGDTNRPELSDQSSFLEIMERREPWRGLGFRVKGLGFRI